MEQSSIPTCQQIYAILQKLTGFHRQLLDTVRMEREALVAADIKGIQEATYAKEALVEAIRQQESERLKRISVLAAAWKRDPRELTLRQVIIGIQGIDVKLADQLRSALNALTVMIERITEQNEDNRALVERSLEHVQNMKGNVLGTSARGPNTYTAQGQRSSAPSEARILSKEV